MIRGGLVSVTFRALSPGEIVDLVVQAGLAGIEWGGDVHVPHGDVACAREVYQRTADSGLAVCSYGSYYRAGTGEPPAFEAVIESALALHAPLVRVWAGRRGSADADAATWTAVVDDSKRILDLAQQAGLGVAYEFHNHTLTDTNASALRLLQAVASSGPLPEPSAGLSSYWQSLDGLDEPTRLEGLRAVLPWLSHVHVQPDGRPLAESAETWRSRLEIVRGSGRDHYALIEYFRYDGPEAFLRDAAAYVEWLG